VRPAARRTSVLHDIEAVLCGWPLPVIGRIADGSLRLDLRCLSVAEEADFLGQLAQLATSPP